MIEYSPYHGSRRKEVFNAVMFNVLSVGARAVAPIVEQVLTDELADGGELHFVHERHGIDVVKYRTMRGEDLPESVSCSISDRFTNDRISDGWRVPLVRALRLDEIPQVRQGRMGDIDISGIRPFPQDLIDKYVALLLEHSDIVEDFMSIYNDRIVSFGLTGPAQVLTGSKDDLNRADVLEEAIAIKDYAENATLLTDVAIVARTPIMLAKSAVKRGINYASDHVNMPKFLLNKTV